MVDDGGEGVDAIKVELVPIQLVSTLGSLSKEKEESRLTALLASWRKY